jgi:RNA-directed DNA polymerase
LDELDKELSKRGDHYVRYADDIVILVESYRAAERVKRSTTTYIEEHLKLKVNKTKSRICRPLELNYLGHRLMGNGQLLLSQESEQRLK